MEKIDIYSYIRKMIAPILDSMLFVADTIFIWNNVGFTDK